MILRRDIGGKSLDWSARYVTLIVIASVAFVCAQVGSRALHLPMYGIEHNPDAVAILLHVFSHNDAGHFLGNYLGLFLYAVLFGVACHQVDMRMNNATFLSGMVLSIAVSIFLALFVVPNDNGVTGVSGIVNYLMGYFWVGVAPILLLSHRINRRRRWLVRMQRRAGDRPALISSAFVLATLIAHGLLDGFGTLDPFRDNPIGNLYHLVGYSVGCGAGVLTVMRWSERAPPPDQRFALRQSHGI